MLNLDAPAAALRHVAASGEALPDWYRDPTGRSELRYWDGRNLDRARHDRRAPRHRPADHAAARTGRHHLAALGTAQGFVVHQRPKLTDLTLEYDVFDRDGRVDRRVIAEAGEVPKDRGRKIRRSLGLDYGAGYELEIRDGQGTVLLRLDLKPVRISEGFGSRYAGVVSRPDGTEVGRIVSAKNWSDTQFTLEVVGKAMGTLDPVRSLIIAAPFMIDLLVERYQKRFRGFHR